MKGRYKAEYQLCYKSDKRLELGQTSVNFEKDGYTSIDKLKADSTSLIEAQIKRHKIPDGEVMSDMLIVEDNNGNEVYVDNDSAWLTVKDGKIIDEQEC